MQKLIALTWFVLLTSPAWSYQGNVSFIHGEVTKTRSEKTEKIEKNAIVKAGDRITTSKNSLAILTMDDGGSFKLNERSDLVIPPEGEGLLILNSGSLFSKIGKQKAGHQFKVKTPVAVMGVRGTQFFTSYGKNGKSDLDLWMCVNEGAVEVTSLAGQKQVLVKSGEGVVVPEGKDVTPPQKYEWTKSLNWNMNPEKGEVIDKTVIRYQKKLLKKDYD